MKTYISILRGINVSGKNLIRMEALRDLYTRLGFLNVNSYIQSGNLVYTAVEEPAQQMQRKIIEAIEQEMKLQVPVLVLDREKLEHIIQENPFISDKELDASSQHVTFLEQPALDFNAADVLEKQGPGERVHFAQEAVYLYCPNGYGKTKLNNNFLEKKLQVPATTRNWKTTLKLFEMAKEAESASGI